MVAADQQAHQVRDDDADEADRTAERHGGPGRKRRTEEGKALRLNDVYATRLGLIASERSRLSDRGSQAKTSSETSMSGSDASSGA